MKRVVTIVGARPQFIKAATVSREIRRRGGMSEVLVHTGQHFDGNMSDVFFEELDIPRPQFHLGIHGGAHGSMTGRMLAAIEEVLLEKKPDWALVYGDTNSTLAGALAAAKLDVPVAHVEAGLRSFNRRMPEELNRILTDHAADLLFAPTDQAMSNLAREGIPDAKVRRVGDVMLDAALYYAECLDDNSSVVQRMGLAPKGYVLATLHRAENTDDETKLRSVIACLNAASERWPVVLPLHPRTRDAMAALGSAPLLRSQVVVSEPVGYLDMIALERNARMIVTDSGGVQKEAYFHHVPCITLREETEWVELVDAGWNVLAGQSVERVRGALDRLTSGPTPAWTADLYGDGNAAHKIVEHLVAL